jgi:hypothetical protein
MAALVLIAQQWLDSRPELRNVFRQAAAPPQALADEVRFAAAEPLDL